MSIRAGLALLNGLWLLFVLSLSAVSCGEEGMAAPKDPGSVAFLVTDESGIPIADVSVQVSAVNSSGGTYYVGMRTGADGRATISSIPAGQREARVTPPATFAEGVDPLSRQVEVIKGRTVSVLFRLRRL